MEIKTVVGQQQSDSGGSRHQNRHHGQRLKRTFFDAFVLAGAQILGGKAGHGCAETVHGCGDKIG